jgi:hypothetical protein
MTALFSFSGLIDKKGALMAFLPKSLSLKSGSRVLIFLFIDVLVLLA